MNENYLKYYIINMIKYVIRQLILFILIANYNNLVNATLINKEAFKFESTIGIILNFQ